MGYLNDGPVKRRDMGKQMLRDVWTWDKFDEEPRKTRAGAKRKDGNAFVEKGDKEWGFHYVLRPESRLFETQYEALVSMSDELRRSIAEPLARLSKLVQMICEEEDSW